MSKASFVSLLVWEIRFAKNFPNDLLDPVRTQFSSRASSRTRELSANDLTSSFSALYSTLVCVCSDFVFGRKTLYSGVDRLFCRDSSIHRSILPHYECFLLHLLSDWLHHSCVFLMAILHEAEAVECKRESQRPPFSAHSQLCPVASLDTLHIAS